MFPVVATFELPLVGPVVIQTYGVAAITAFVLGIIAARRRLAAAGVDAVHGYWAPVFLIPAIAIGGKVLPLLQTPFYRAQLAQMAEGPLGWLAPFATLALPGGSVFSAAMVACLSGAAYARFYGISFVTCLDAVAPAAAIAIPVMRVGCLGAGCCYGTASGLPWAVVYGVGSAAPPTDVPLGMALHPTPAYEAIAVTALAVVLWRLPPVRPGVVTALFVGGYSAIRFATDFVRGDSLATVGPIPVSPTQLVAMALMLASALFFLRPADESEGLGTNG